MSVLRHLADVVPRLLEADPHRILTGEDVADGGMLGLSRRVGQNEQLRKRLISTPLAPASQVAHVAGLALSGYRPIALLPSAGQLLEGFAALREIARLPWRTGDERSVPALFVAPYGPGFGLGGDTSDTMDAHLAAVPGLRVLCLGQAAEAGALLEAAAEFEAGAGPKVLLLPRNLLLQELAPDQYMTTLQRDPNRAHVIRRGSQATVFTWGAAVGLVLNAVETAELDVTVVDLSSLSPLDRPTLVETAKATGKLVVVHGGPQAHGIGAELAGLFADEAILYLDAPVLRVTGAEQLLAPLEEHHGLPEIPRITEAIEHVAHY